MASNERPPHLCTCSQPDWHRKREPMKGGHACRCANHEERKIK